MIGRKGAAGPGPAAAPSVTEGLRRGVLTFAEVAGQSIATIAPSAAASAVVPALLAIAGPNAWICIALAAVLCLMVARQLRDGVARVTGPGALFTVVTEGIGPLAGVVVGFALALAYVLAAGAGLAATGLYFDLTLGSVLPSAFIPPVPLVSAGLAGVVLALSRRDVRFSMRATLVAEAGTLALVAAVALCALIVAEAKSGRLPALATPLHPADLSSGPIKGVAERLIG